MLLLMIPCYSRLLEHNSFRRSKGQAAYAAPPLRRVFFVVNRRRADMQSFSRNPDLVSLRLLRERIQALKYQTNEGESHGYLAAKDQHR